jgi:hypothetical protein
LSRNDENKFAETIAISASMMERYITHEVMEEVFHMITIRNQKGII